MESRFDETQMGILRINAKTQQVILWDPFLREMVQMVKVGAAATATQATPKKRRRVTEEVATLGTPKREPKETTSSVSTPVLVARQPLQETLRHTLQPSPIINASPQCPQQQKSVKPKRSMDYVLRKDDRGPFYPCPPLLTTVTELEGVRKDQTAVYRVAGRVSFFFDPKEGQRGSIPCSSYL